MTENLTSRNRWRPRGGRRSRPSGSRRQLARRLPLAELGTSLPWRSSSCGLTAGMVTIGLGMVFGACSGRSDPRDGGASDGSIRDTSVTRTDGRNTPATSGVLRLAPERPEGYLTYQGGKALFVLDVGLEPAAGRAELAVTAAGSLSVQVLPSKNLEGSGVRELLITPDVAHVGRTLAVDVRLLSERRVIATAKATVKVTAWSPPDPLDAERDAFAEYLATQRPQLGVTGATSWEWWGEEQSLVVAHHLYLSEQGQLFLSRHVTIAPDDWIKATFRPRNQAKVVWAGKIDSISASLAVHDEPVPDAVR